MRISDTPVSSLPTASTIRRPKNPEEAAKEFEQVLVKQFVRTMTDKLFDQSLAGDDAPGYVGAYGDMQKDVLAEELSKHLVESGRLRISDLLMRQWQRTEGTANSEPRTEDVSLLTRP